MYNSPVRRRRPAHWGGDLGIFAARPIKEGETILPFYGQLVYLDLEAATKMGSSATDTAQYGPRAQSSELRCTVREWKRSALQMALSDTFWRDAARHPLPSFVSTHIATKRCSTERTAFSARPVWIAPAFSCAAGLANAPRKEGDAYAELMQHPLPVGSEEQLVVPGTARVRVTKDIVVGKEILVDYGDVYAYFHL